MSPINRRTFIRGAAFGIAAAIAPTLAGCSATTGGTIADVAERIAPLPTFVAITKGPTADLAGNSTVRPVFFKPVTKYFTSVSGKVGDGSQVTALVTTYNPPPPPNSAYLKFIDDKANVRFDVDVVPADQYSAKFAAVMAGGNIPDYVEFLSFQMPPKFPQLLDSAFSDLTKHLSGDAVKKYPNLANIPTPSWVGCRIDGKIYGVPIHRAPFGNPLLIRPDVLKELGVTDPAPKDTKSFLDLCTEITSAKDGRYALGGYSSATGVNFSTEFMDGIFHVPNTWKYSREKLVHMYETPQWFEAVAYVKKLWKAGVYHPDTPGMQLSQTVSKNRAGNILMYTNGITALTDPSIPVGIELGVMIPFGADGGDGYCYPGPSMFSFTAIKKSSEHRVEELLRLMNYLAAPYGSAEANDIGSGKEGVHFTEKSDGTRVVTPRGLAEVASANIFRIAAGPGVLIGGNPAPTPEILTRIHAYEQKTTSMQKPDPTVGHYSPTASSATSANLAVQDSATSYILGRSSLATLKAATATWKSSVGGKMRTEYLKSMEAS